MSNYKFTALSNTGLYDGFICLVRDTDEEATDLHRELAAHVRSGDYFSTLATNLDSLCDNLPQNSDANIWLERYVRDLLYLDSHYKIVPKSDADE